MSTEQKDLEQNALASRLGRAWTNFKQGKLIGYKWMAVILLLITAGGLWWYISHERKRANSNRWVTLDEAHTPSQLEKLAEENPGTIQAKLARLRLACYHLGEGGIDQRRAAIRPEHEKKAVENIESARAAFGTLLEDFKDDPVFKPICLLGLYTSEAELVAVPDPPGQLIKYKGDPEKSVEYLEQLAEAAAPGTPWATDSRKLADRLRGKDRDEFVRITREFSMPRPILPLGPDPFAPPGLPGTGPALPGGAVVPVIPGPK
jgi:hypothetical protein